MSVSPDQPFSFRIDFPPALPISVRAEEIVATIQNHQVVILAGETGSGKTTQIPKMCLAASRGTRGRIACTQPRRVAALSISRRVAEELNVAWGREVGCKIRFNDQTTPGTVIKFLTDGMLLAEVQGDPMLREYDTVIIDEAHERSLNIDFLLGHLRTLRYKRPELKIIITSATIDTEAFSKAFDDAPIIQVSGRTFPVEVIYAPLDEFGSDAAEGDERESKSEALHYIDGAVEAVERIVRESDHGDILVFMPAERDIREMGDLLEGRRLRQVEVVPLFGRLSNAEQQRVFSPTQKRKIVIATNIAETSLTIPGIRFVVDTGLARLSRYSPQARTRRLPIEPVSQSSADQRKGRSGRVAEGVCIRLYSEKDFLERPRFTQPEIQRANLADVILRMKAFGLGDIERFPFINMPAAKSIRAGYLLLEELGALAEVEAGEATADGAGEPAFSIRQLTPVGRELARLPVDPTVGRMILQARNEKALREVLIIASGLSVQDPRDRPLDKQQQADTAHRRFTHPDSDFLSLLNIWEAYHDQFETMGQAKLRRFCRDHFLSYTRMREWRDIHAQLREVVQDRGEKELSSVFHGLKENSATKDKDPLAFDTPAYRAIHRSILAGLLGNIAQRDDESGLYKATHDRKVSLFPGSILFKREDPKKKTAPQKSAEAAAKDKRAPRWIMAAEIMETTRLYARTCARLDPRWALDLGRHVIRVAHSEPFWNAEAGRVLVKQRSRLYGLELESKSVGYGRIDPDHATEIFIREGLVNDTITWPFDFIAHNRLVREKIEASLTRMRDSGYLNLDEAIYRFYATRLENEMQVREDAGDRARDGISAVPDLIELVRQRKGEDPRFLMLEPEDLRDPASLAHDAEAFPEAVPVENLAMPLNYAYKPGQADDGVTLDVKVREAGLLDQAALDWAVPGHIEAKVEHYLRALPKELRRGFVPLAETAKSLTKQLISRDKLTGRRETLPEALAAQIREQHRVAIDLDLWAGKTPPDHLRVRVRVTDDEGRELCASRELVEIRAALGVQSREASATVAKEDPGAWQRARAKWEKPAQTVWTFGDIPHRVLVTEQAGVPVYAWPGLLATKDGVALRLFKTDEERATASDRGLSALLELQLRYELGWLERDLRALREIGTLTATLVPMEQLQADAYENVKRWVCDAARVIRLPTPEPTRLQPAPYVSEKHFVGALDRAKDDLRGLVPRLTDLLREILSSRQALLVHTNPYEGMARDLAALLPPDFLRKTPYARLSHLPRYLKAMKLRAERWRQSPAKDAERAKQLAPYLAAVKDDEMRWLVEEFRVSLFAQELGTAEPVSVVKLDRVLAEARKGGRVEEAAKIAEPAREPVIRPMAPTDKKTTPLKNFGALDRLFRK